MAKQTKIEWCDHTFNPWTGCQKVSPACDHCYAEGWAKRSGLVEWGPGKDRRRTSANNWNGPRKWQREADLFKAMNGRRQRVFCASLADVFDNQVPPEWRADLWQLIRETPDLDWLLLTKRPQNIAKMLPEHWGDGWPNVWLGTTAEDQERADQRIPHLLVVPAAVHFLSYEPALGPLDLRAVRWGHASALTGIDWVICGGESGPGARPMRPEWARSARDQCRPAGVAFFFKQHGEYLVGERGADGSLPIRFQDGEEFDVISDGHDILLSAACDEREGPRPLGWRNYHGWQGELVRRVGKKQAGALLDGRAYREFPDG